ncbi:MAG: substrate-binding domain-containing protein [Candidatus Adiutrix sp.]
MPHLSYFITTFLLALVAAPLIVSISAMFAGFFLPLMGAAVVLNIVIWAAYARQAQLPHSFLARYLPIYAAFAYYMVLWIIIFALSSYRFEGGMFDSSRLILWTWPYFSLIIFFEFTDDFILFPYVQMGLYLLIFTTMALSGERSRKPLESIKGAVSLSAFFVALSALAIYQHFSYQAISITYAHQALRVSDEIEPYHYQPFSKKNRLRLLDEEPTLTIASDFPKLDGAIVAYPLYGATAETLYVGLNEETAREYVQANKTQTAYERLFEGTVDIFFGFSPSPALWQQAETMGLTLRQTPIAQEAFVFFVNSENPTESLTLNQLRDIYRQEIISWETVGGPNKKIIPFQSPENSASRTVMEALVMQGEDLPPPLIKGHITADGQIVNTPATYRNYSSAIGYSFLYAVNDMPESDAIRFLAIDGVLPTAENIRNGTYPLTMNIYAVTTENPTENSQKIIDWLLSDQGQRLIEENGYIPLRGN